MPEECTVKEVQNEFDFFGLPFDFEKVCVSTMCAAHCIAPLMQTRERRYYHFRRELRCTTEAYRITPKETLSDWTGTDGQALTYCAGFDPHN